MIYLVYTNKGNPFTENIMRTINQKFLSEKFNSNEVYVINNSDFIFEKETEKAVLIKAVSDYGTLKFWCPKSCIYEKQEIIEAALRLAAEKSKIIHDEMTKQETRINAIVGSFVNHKKYGKGIVSNVLEDGGLLVINFKKETKTIANNKKFLSLI